MSQQQQQVLMSLPDHLSSSMPLHSSWSVSGTSDNSDNPMSQIFDEFCAADTFLGIIELFRRLCSATGLLPTDHCIFYQELKTQLNSWKAQSIWMKLDKRASNLEYKQGTACNNSRVIVIGAGPCGLRVAIELVLLGAKVVIVEKRDSFSRNNVLHLWPFLIHDLKALGAKKFFGKFCAGSIDHISIRTLQCILLKIALLVGVEVHPGVSFEGFIEPQSSKMTENVGWHASFSPADHPVGEFIFDVCISADGKRNTMTEIKRTELRGKLAIGITANFINYKTQAEASVEEISGVAYIFNQKFFKDLRSGAGIDLENIVYYKDETHYFVMTAKKRSLLSKGVLLQDYDNPELLLSKENVNQDALCNYAREAADYSTNHCLPKLDFALNYGGQPDVDVFDFTSMFAAEHACRVEERQGHRLLIGLVGDTLLEPFWPTGSGCARGFLGAMDAAWMVRSWESGEMTPLEVIAERESIYLLLSQTKPDNLSKNYAQYTVDPNTRYPNLQTQVYRPHQVQSLYDGNGNVNGHLIIKTPSKRHNKAYVERKSSLNDKYLKSAMARISQQKKEDIKRSESLSLKSNQLRAHSTNPASSLKRIRDVHANENAMNSRETLKSYDNYSHSKTNDKKIVDDSSPLAKRQNRVTVLAKNLASMFKGEPVHSEDRKQLSSESVSGKFNRISASDICCFCKGQVRVVDRCIAEDFLFHRNCFFCEYCGQNISINSYSYIKNYKGRGVFCHNRCEPQLKVAEDALGHSTLQTSAKRIYLRQNQRSANEGTSKEHKQNRLRQSGFFDAAAYDDLQSSTEEELNFSDNTSCDEKPDFSWEESVRQRIHNSRKTNVSPAVKCQAEELERMNDGANDADWETDSDTDPEIPVGEYNDKTNRILYSQNSGVKDNISCMKNLVFQKENSCKRLNAAEGTKQSPMSNEILQNRMAFFKSVSQPVRINARTFLGLDSDSKPPSKETAVPEVKPGGYLCNNQLKDEEEKDQHLAQDTDCPKINREEIQILYEKEVRQEEGEEVRRDTKQESKKNQIQIRKKKLQQRKKRVNRKKGEKHITASITSTKITDVYQRASLVPLSAASSSDDTDDEKLQKSEDVMKLASGEEEIMRNLTTRSSIVADETPVNKNDAEENTCLSAIDPEKLSGFTGEHVLEAEEEKYKSKLMVQSSLFVGNDPRPDLLSAEAMFRSSEDAGFVTKFPGSEEISGNSSSEELLASEHLQSEGIGENMTSEQGASRLLKEAVESDEKDKLKSKNNEQMNCSVVIASVQDGCIQCLSNYRDPEISSPLNQALSKSSSSEEYEEAREFFPEEEQEREIFKKCDKKLITITKQKELEPPDLGVRLHEEALALTQGVDLFTESALEKRGNEIDYFLTLVKEGHIRNLYLAPKAEVENFSEDDKDLYFDPVLTAVAAAGNEDHILLDENINWILNEAKEKNNQNKDQEVFTSSNVSISQQCLCMKDNEANRIGLTDCIENEISDKEGRPHSEIDKNQTGVTEENTRTLQTPENIIVADFVESQGINGALVTAIDAFEANETQSKTKQTETAVKKDEDTKGINSSVRSSSFSSLCSIRDAKLRFFQEVPQPVRIDPRQIFKDDFLTKEKMSNNELLEKASLETVRVPAFNAECTNLIFSELVHPENGTQQNEDVLEHEKKRTMSRLLPAIPTNQLPFALSTYSIARRAAVHLLGTSLRSGSHCQNVLSSEGNIHLRVEEDRQLLSSSDSCLWNNNLSCFDLASPVKAEAARRSSLQHELPAMSFISLCPESSASSSGPDTSVVEGTTCGKTAIRASVNKTDVESSVPAVVVCQEESVIVCTQTTSSYISASGLTYCNLTDSQDTENLKFSSTETTVSDQLVESDLTTISEE